MSCITVLVTNRKMIFLQSLIEYGAIGINSMMNMTNYELFFFALPALNILLLRFSGFLF